MKNQQGHIPVLLDEVLHFMHPQDGKVYVDATLGAGGHTRALLTQALGCTVIGLDWDKSVIDTTGVKLQEEFGSRFIPVLGNFAKIAQLIEKVGYEKVDGVLADFGTSQIQIRNMPGFSFQQDTFLDMRFNTGMSQLTAYDVINTYSAEKLADIFFEYGQESHGRKIARAIAEQRKRKRIKTTFELADLIKKLTPGSYHKIHPATKVFQALRIFVNQELEHIKTFLQASLSVLKPQARLVCISFHSLEDRIVKHFFRNHNEKNDPQSYFKMLTKGACMTSKIELDRNRSARSARLRAGILLI